MCWRNYNKPLKKLIAEENVPIFKVCTKSSRFSNTVASYFRDYYYQLGVVYKLSYITPREVNFHFEIDEGFHSYLAGCTFKHNIVFSTPPMRWVCSYNSCYDPIKVSGYIPKGSEYYVNEDGECVSNSICLTAIEEL